MSATGSLPPSALRRKLQIAYAVDRHERPRPAIRDVRSELQLRAPTTRCCMTNEGLNSVSEPPLDRIFFGFPVKDLSVSFLMAMS